MMLSQMGFPGDSSGKGPTANPGDTGDADLALCQEDSPGETEARPTLLSLPGESHGQGPGGLQSIGLPKVGHN